MLKESSNERHRETESIKLVKSTNQSGVPMLKESSDERHRETESIKLDQPISQVYKHSKAFSKRYPF